MQFCLKTATEKPGLSLQPARLLCEISDSKLQHQLLAQFPVFKLSHSPAPHNHVSRFLEINLLMVSSYWLYFFGWTLTDSLFNQSVPKFFSVFPNLLSVIMLCIYNSVRVVCCVWAPFLSPLHSS